MIASLDSLSLVVAGADAALRQDSTEQQLRELERHKDDKACLGLHS